MKIKKSDLLNMVQEQNDVIAKLVRQVNCHHEDIIRLEGIVEPEPQLKQLDQSVFDGEPEQIKWAMVTSEGAVLKLEFKPVIKDGLWHWIGGCRQHSRIGQYDASNWQNSLIERDVAKEPLEVDLSSELTGSELCRAMLERGDKRIMCVSLSGYAMVITGFDGDKFVDSRGVKWGNAAPINNQDEPLTASEVGL